MSSTTLRANVSAEQTEEELLNHTCHNTAFFFGLTYSWGSAGCALFAEDIDFFSHCLNNIPNSFSRSTENKKNGFVITIQNSAIDFCCKAQLTGRIQSLISCPQTFSLASKGEKSIRIYSKPCRDESIVTLSTAQSVFGILSFISHHDMFLWQNQN